jgi:HEAT repeat protein
MKLAIALPGLVLVAFGAYAQTSPAAAWDILNAGLKDKNAEKRKAAVTAVGTIGAMPKAVRILEDALSGDPDPEVRQAAAGMLGDMKSRSSMPKLKQALEKEDEVSFSAARALWAMGDRSGRALFEELADGGHTEGPGAMEQAKRQARKTLHDPAALARMGSLQAADALLGPFSIGLKLGLELRKDQGAPARLIAITMLDQECTPSGVKVMESVVTNDKNDAVRAAAARGLGHCGTKQSEAKLQPLLTFDKYAVALVAAAAIVRIEARPNQIRGK